MPHSLRPRPAAEQHGLRGVRRNTTETDLYSFTGGSDGKDPIAGLINVSGTLYGTTCGCSGNSGTVFKITRSGKETVLHNFKGGTDGQYPEAGLINVNGTLYGTTFGGGASGAGTVFKITTSGTETVLHSFAGGTDGADPIAGLTNVNGTLYGTTQRGGTGSCSTYYTGCGAVFSITTSGTETVLHSFTGNPDGASPGYGNLTNVNGTLYGTTTKGGASNHGTIFTITTSGAESVLYSFAGGTDGAYPDAGLTNVSGTLYGTTGGGGASNNGTVFTLTAAGAENVLYRFAGGMDGSSPQSPLINVKGTLYSSTFAGGGSGCYGAGCGTIFQITTSGTESVLYSFAGGTDGVDPNGRLISVNGTLYGTTYEGGASGDGMVFSLSLPLQVTYTLLHSFPSGSGDGIQPIGGLVNVNGTLYGTTELGPPGHGCYGIGCGTVFSITPSGSEQVLHSFPTGSGDGIYPYAGLSYINGTLYGTSEKGGIYYSRGTVFTISSSGAESVIHSFNNYSGDGAYPEASVINVVRGVARTKGTLYGTTAGGGVAGLGTVFAISPSGESVVHSFGGSGDGQNPYGGLKKIDDTLYGTTTNGGAYNAGTVFAISKSGTETVLHSFGGGSGDGESPQYVKLIDVNGTLYGTTEYGGSNGLGTVFAITPSGAERVLYSFSGYPGDGENPVAGLINVNGTLYGMTSRGGVGNANSGTVFSITLSGAETMLYAFSNDYTSGGDPTDSLIYIDGKLYGTTAQGGADNYGTVFSLSGFQRS